MGFLTKTVNLLQAGCFVNKWRYFQTKHHTAKSAMLRRHKILLTLASLSFVFISLTGSANHLTAAEIIKPGNNLQRQLQKLVGKGAYAITRNGKIVASHNIDRKLVPASISKFFTVLAALDRLGPDYRFKTEIYLDDRDNLYIKGYGDPFLISETVAEIMLTLQKSGVKRINNILIDDSSYRLKTPADGAGSSLNPYDVAGGAVVVNFNTINIVVDKDGKVRSGEPQTPLLPIMTRTGKSFKPGEYRVNISSRPENVLQMAGELFRSMQSKAGIIGDGIIKRRRAPDGEPIIICGNSSVG